MTPQEAHDQICNINQASFSQSAANAKAIQEAMKVLMAQLNALEEENKELKEAAKQKAGNGELAEGKGKVPKNRLKEPKVT